MFRLTIVNLQKWVTMKKVILLSLFACGLVLVTSACFLFSTPRGPLKFSPDKLPEAQVGVPYEAKVSVTQNVTPVGGISISEGFLPRGLTLEKVKSENSGLISGTPAEAGTFPIKIFVWCYGTNVNGQVGEMSYTIVVK